jgi:acetyl-CoA carboxylase biotin carboxylase subunit
LAAGEGPGRVRIDTHLEAGDEVSPHYDSLLAKVIAHGDTREETIQTMLRALSASTVKGLPTTIPFHLAVLASPAFQRGEYDTASIPGWNADQ